MTILALRLRVIGGPSLMGLISGFLLLAVPSSTSILYLHSSLLCGITYDLIMKTSYNKPKINRNIIIISAILSGFIESISVFEYPNAFVIIPLLISIGLILY